MWNSSSVPFDPYPFSHLPSDLNWKIDFCGLSGQLHMWRSGQSSDDLTDLLLFLYTLWL